jgi:energy-coupling factor transporter ATP-binding protein EcfA2
MTSSPRTFPHAVSPPPAATPPGIDLREDQYFVGRQEELPELIRALQRGRHVLVTGPKGIGKTRLMREALGIMSGENARAKRQMELFASPRGHLSLKVRRKQYRMVFIEHASPMGDCLREMAERLLLLGLLRLETSGPISMPWPDAKKLMTSMGSIRVQEAIVDSIRSAGTPVLVFFDSLDRITVSNQMFLEKVLGAAVICAATVQVKESFHFRKIWSSFTRIELGPLEPVVAARLIDHCLSAHAVRVIDPELYRTEILKAANGNPFQIKNLIWQGSRGASVSMEEIRKLRRTQEGEFFNMGPIYIIGASIFTLFKIFSFGTGNREFYIYFSALGFMVFLMFRVFRTFFLFKPQRIKR